jgi:hypothetical protein
MIILLKETDRRQLASLNPWWSAAARNISLDNVPKEVIALADRVNSTARGIFLSDKLDLSELDRFVLLLESRGFERKSLFHCVVSKNASQTERDVSYFRREVLPASESATVLLSCGTEVSPRWYETAKKIRSAGIDRVVVVGTIALNDFVASSILIDRIRVLRERDRLPALKEHKLLARAAAKHVPHVISARSTSHSNSLGSLWRRVRYEGYRGKTVGENICLGEGNPLEIVNLWMDSPSHRKNLLNNIFTDFGLSMRCSGQRVDCVAVLTLGGGGYYPRTWKGLASYYYKRLLYYITYFIPR